ncbi:MAG: vitamin K epoxide reductase family protein [Bacteroidota bacterium]
MKNLVKKYLHQNQFSNVAEDFEDLFQSHPNYPSLYAVTDTFDLLSIENIAIKIPKEQIEELPKEFMAIYKNSLVLVTKTNEKISIENQDAKKELLSYSDFLESWNGVIIVIEPNIKITSTTNKNISSWLLYTLPFIALSALSIYYNKYNFNAISTLLISLIGLLASVFILQEKFGVKNEIASKFCNINPNTSCNSVIKSENSKINKYFNFTDLPLLFFSINLLAILIQPQSSSFIIGLVSLSSIPVLLYSVWLQKFQLKNWCVLCLVVSFLILVQSLVFVFTNNFSIDTTLPINLSVILTSSILVTSFWLFLKPILEKKYALETTNTELSKFKRNFNLFQFLSKDIEEYDDFEKLKGIEFGNEHAATQLTLILSPSCGHCHTAFSDAYELFQKFPEKIRVNILFNINPENNDNPYKIILENLLALNLQNPQKAQEAIIDWHINRLDLENWKTKWTVESPHMLVNQQIQNQYYWCLKNEFNYTPVKIINGNQFPNGYEINELKYFINDFHQEIENEKSLKAV